MRDPNEEALRDYLSKEERKEQAAAAIESRSDDLYNEKIAALPNCKKAGSKSIDGRQGYNTWSALDDIDWSDLPAIGRAIRDNDQEAVGRLVIEAVKAVLRKDAQYEAEDEVSQ